MNDEIKGVVMVLLVGLVFGFSLGFVVSLESKQSEVENLQEKNEIYLEARNQQRKMIDLLSEKIRRCETNQRDYKCFGIWLDKMIDLESKKVEQEEECQF